MNSDQEIIESAYEDVLKELYARLFESFTETGGDPAQLTHAEQHFVTGIGLARTSRDRAIVLLSAKS